MSGRRAVEMVWENLLPSQVMTEKAFENAITVNMAIGGSTNAVVHLIAIAGRLGIDLPLHRFDEISRRTPCLVNVKPSGEFLMEDFFQAGGVGAVMREVLDLLHRDALTVNGKNLGTTVEKAECFRRDVILPRSQPLYPEGGTVVLTGNLAPDGAVLKQTAASPHLLQHRGPAYVFENYQQMREQIDGEDLPVTEQTILVMKNGGPKGGPGFPEWGQIPMPKALLRQGINDMVRVSDARMSGTSFGTVVLHVAPESAIGGPLDAVMTGDEIELDVERRSLTLCVPQQEIELRLARNKRTPIEYPRGYAQLFMKSVLQANEGCDFDFLRPRRGTGASSGTV
jgi:dihydroxy-acid dehydratase